MKLLRIHAITLGILLGAFTAPIFSQTPANSADEPPAAVFPKRSVALAFLGSRLRFKTVIAPLLRKYGFHATLFVDDPPPPVADDLGTGEGDMTWVEIRELTKALEIGNFTAHPKAETGGWIMWPRREQIRQLETVEQRCEAAGIGKPTALFYPLGMNDPNIFQFLADKGYTMGVTILPPGVVDFYTPAIHHPLLIPSLMGTELFYRALDKVRAPDFPQDRILVLTFDDSSTSLARWGSTAALLRFLSEYKYTVLSIGDLATYANAGEAMRAKRFWDMRYAGGGSSGVFFTRDRATGHWWMDKMPAAAIEQDSKAPEPPHIPTMLERQLEGLIVPQVDFERLPLESCIEWLRQTAARLRGGSAAVNFVVAQDVDTFTPVTLHLINTPFTEVLRYVSGLTGVGFSIERYAITVKSAASPEGGIGRVTPATTDEMLGLETLTIPRLDINEASLDAVMDLLCRKALAASGGTMRLCFVTDPALDVSAPVTLHFRNIPFIEALRYVGDLANAEFAIQRYAIVAGRKTAHAVETSPKVIAPPTPFALVQ